MADLKERHPTLYRARVEGDQVCVEQYEPRRRNWWHQPWSERDCASPLAALCLALQDEQRHLTGLETLIDGELGTVAAMVESRHRMDLLRAAIDTEASRG